VEKTEDMRLEPLTRGASNRGPSTIWAASNGGAGAAAVRGRGTGSGDGDDIYGWGIWVAGGHGSGARRWVARVAYCIVGAHRVAYCP
jgi:hypothetical protein